MGRPPDGAAYPSSTRKAPAAGRPRPYLPPMTDQEAAHRLPTAAEAFRATVSRFLRDPDVHPQLVVMAAARVTGELAASAALATDDDVEEVANELAEVVREVARDHGETLRLVTGEVAGSA